MRCSTRITSFEHPPQTMAIAVEPASTAANIRLRRTLRGPYGTNDTMRLATSSSLIVFRLVGWATRTRTRQHCSTQLALDHLDVMRDPHNVLACSNICCCLAGRIFNPDWMFTLFGSQSRALSRNGSSSLTFRCKPLNLLRAMN